MNNRRKTALAAGALSVVALTGVAAIVPAAALAQTGEDGISTRLDRIRDALSGLVSDGTVTQEQADKVATALDEQMPMGGPGMGRHGGPMGFGGGPGMDAVTEALGITADELRSALQDGQTLAEVAESKGVSRDALIAAMVAEAEEHLASAVEDGRLTQEQADERKADLAEHLAERVDQAGGMHGPGGMGGRGGMHGPGGGGHGMWQDGDADS